MNGVNVSDNCIGCSACIHTCAHGAIYIKMNEEGFYVTEIDVSKCVNCGLCKSVCPMLNNEIYDKSEFIDAYAAYSKSNDLRMNSTSGGIFTSVAEGFINKCEGVVFGVWLNQKKEAVHIRVENCEELHKLRGSKYIQSKVGNTFIEVKDLLTEGRYVLFSGTPCQIEGLRRFLRKDYEKLFTIDLICHGVPSPGMFKDYIAFLEKRYNNILEYKFRQKNVNKTGQSYDTRIVYNKNNKHRIKMLCGDDDIYTINFLGNALQNRSCFECKFASLKRCSDLTLGDYWGVEEGHEELSDINGVSLVLVNTQKGEFLLDIAKDLMYLTKTTKEKILKKNLQLKNPPQMSPRRSLIYKNYKTNKFGYKFYYRYFMGRKMLVYLLKRKVRKVISK